MASTNSAVNAMPAAMNCRGLPWAKSRLRFLLDWTPNAAARVLPITWARDRPSREVWREVSREFSREFLGFSFTSGSITNLQGESADEVRA